MTFFNRTISRAMLLAIGAAIIVGLFLALLSQCEKGRNQAAQGRVNAGQATAGAATGEVSLNTLEGVVANDTATDGAVANGVAATRAAPEANRDPVAINALCQFKSARNKPECAR